MTPLLKDILFWLFFGWFAFPFFFNISYFHRGRFANGLCPYLGGAYIFFIILFFAGTYVHPVVLWIGFGAALVIYLSMFVRIVYFYEEINNNSEDKKKKTIYKKDIINM